MSAPEPLDLPEPEPEIVGPCSRVPYLTEEMLAARLEDPGFAEVLGRARARARSEEYRPERHHPHRSVGRGEFRVDPEAMENLEAIRERFAARGARWREVPAEREAAIESTRHLKAL